MKTINFSFSVLLISLNSYAQPYILVGETYSAKVSKIDPLTNTKIASIRVADSVGVPNPNISNIALDTIHNWAYVSCRTANAISIINLNTWTATYPNIPIPGLGMQPGGLAINKTADTLYVTTLGPNGIQDSLNPLETFAISGNTFPPTLTKIGSVPVGKHPIKLILSHDGKYAIVSCRNQARITVVNLLTNTVVFRHNYPNVNYEPEGLDIHPTANLVYCFTHGQNTIDILDLNSMAIVNTVPIAYSGTPPQPSGGKFSPNGNLMLVSGQTSGKMYLFNTTNPYNPIQLPPVIPSGGVQPHMAVFLNDTIAYIPNTNNTQPVGSVSYMSTGNYPRLLGQVSGIWNGPLSMVSVKTPVSSIQFVVSDRWNMLSVPLTVSDYRKSTLFPTAVSPAFAFQGTYVQKDTLANGIGYWLKFDSAQTVSMAGQMRSIDSINVQPGWNLIGSISQLVPVSTIISHPPGLIASQFFGYGSSGYVRADSIVPGKGYWVKVSGTGILILSMTAVSSSAAIKSGFSR